MLRQLRALILVIVAGLALAGLDPADARAQESPADERAAPASEPPAAEAPGEGEAPVGGGGEAEGETEAAGEGDVEAGIERLIQTLEDPEARQALIERLRAESQPAPAETEAEPGLLDSGLEALRQRQAMIEELLLEIARSWRQLPFLMIWVENEFARPDRRAFWGEVALRLVGAFALGALIRSLTLRLVIPAPAAAAAGPWRATLRRLAGTAVFAIVTFAALTLPDHPQIMRGAGMDLLQGLVLASLAVTVVELMLGRSPDDYRLVPLDPDTATLLKSGLNRVLRLSILGYFVLSAMLAVGLPWTIHAFLLHVVFALGLIVAVVLVLRLRERVGAAIREFGETRASRFARFLPATFLARSWHIWAILWLVVHYAVWALRVPGGFRFLAQATVGTFAVLVLARLLLLWIERAFKTGVPMGAIGDDAEEHLPGVVRRADRYARPLRTVLKFAVVLVAGLALSKIWSTGVLDWLGSDAGRAVTGFALRLGMIVVVTIVLVELVSLIATRYMEDVDDEGLPRHSNRTRTMASIFKNVGLVLLVVIALLLGLSELGVEAGPLLAGAGVIGLAIGFGSQKLVQDLITGVFILMGDTARVGDVIEVAGRSGVVESMSMRTVTLRGYDGNVHTIPYSTIDTITNMTKDHSQAVLDIRISYHEDVDRVMEVLREIDAQLRREWPYRRQIIAPLEMAGVDALNSSEVVIRARSKVTPGDQWLIRREFTRRVKLRFDALGIEIPYPHQTVYFGVDKEGKAPPLFIETRRQEIAGEAADDDNSAHATAPTPSRSAVGS